MAQDRAYVTFLAGNSDSVMGVVGLAKGLSKVNSAYPLVVAVLPDVPAEHRRILEDRGCVVREIELIYPPKKHTKFATADYLIISSKLSIWEFVEYSKMIYLDANVQVLDNIDHLFNLDDGYFYAVMDCFCEKTWSRTSEDPIGHCQLLHNKVPWPNKIGQLPSYFNTGMFMFEPSLTTYNNLLSTLRTTPLTPFDDQDLLNMYFKNMYRPIEPVYNLGLSMLWHHPENFELEKVKVVRYCVAGSKPWMYNKDEKNMQREDVKMMIRTWWDIYEDEPLYYENCPQAAAELVNMEPVIAALPEADAAQCITAPPAT